MVISPKWSDDHILIYKDLCNNPPTPPRRGTLAQRYPPSRLSLLRTSAQANESAAGLQAEHSGVINEAGALGGEGGDQLAPPEVQGLDVTPVPE